MSQSLSDILEQCVEALERGEMSIGECIEQFPQYGSELSTLLQISEELKAAPAVAPSPAFRQHAQTRMQNLISAYGGRRASDQTAKHSAVRAPKKIAKKPRWALRMITTIFLVITLIASGTGVASAASSALPGDTLFGVKTTLEDARLVLSDNEGDVALLNQYADERVAEIQALARAGRYEDISVAAQAYQNTSTKLAQALGKLAAGERRDALNSQVSTAHEQRAQTLTELFDKVPAQGQKGIQSALNVGPPDHAGGPPDGKGKPDQAGCPPGDKGGRPEYAGNPENNQNSGAEQSGNGGPPDDKCDSDAP